MKKYEEQKMNKEFLQKNFKKENKTFKKINKREIDKILSEYAAKHKTIGRNKKKHHLNTLKLNKTFNPKGHISIGEPLSNRKKIEQELSTFSKENRKFFRNCLNKHNFQMEIYIPQNLKKKEYSDKNFLINQLIHIEKTNRNIKEIVESIDKDTKTFSKQYKQIKTGNKAHQATYINNVEKIYQSNGYKIEHIEYKPNENIFAPSFLLDRKYRKEQLHNDVSTYSYKTFNLNKDKKLLKKFENIVFNKYKDHVRDEENQLDTNENWNYYFNEKDEEMKKEVIEEQRIMNMSRKEYHSYSKKLKRDIDIAKKRLAQLTKTENNDNDNNSNSNTITINASSPTSNRTIYTSSLKADFHKSKYPKTINRVVKQKRLLKEKNDENNIFLSAKGLDLQSDFNERLPSINLVIDSKDDDKEGKNKINKQFMRMKTFSSLKREAKREKTPKYAKTFKLYKFLKNKTEKENFPYDEINNYFKMYSHRNLPKANPYLGSNIHGFLVEFQNQVKENNFFNFAKGNENMKFDINCKYFPNNKNTLENQIEKIDDKIGSLHYELLEKLIANNKKELLSN